MGQGGEVRGHEAGVTDDGHSINPVRQKCRLIALATGTIGLNLRPPSGRSRRAPVARSRRGLLDVLLVRVDALHPATHVRPLARHSTLRSVARYRLRFLGQCQHTDWIGLCRAMLDRPVGTYGDNVQWAASGGHPSNRANAPPLAPSTWNRNPCWGCSNDGN